MRSDARRALRRRNTVRACTAASPAQSRERDEQRPLFLDGKTERERESWKVGRTLNTGVPGGSRWVFFCLFLAPRVFRLCRLCRTLMFLDPLGRDVVQLPRSASSWIFKNLLYTVCGNSNFSADFFFLNLCASI